MHTSLTAVVGYPSRSAQGISPWSSMTQSGLNAMELPDAGYLYTLSLIAIAYVGFTAIVLILRQSAGGTLLPIDTLVSRLFMGWGFLLTYLSITPMLLAAFDLSRPVVWRISSALAGLSFVVMQVSYPILRGRITAEPTPLHVWLHVAAGLALGAVLFRRVLPLCSILGL